MTANRNRIMGSRKRASLVTDCALAQKLQVTRGWFVSGSTRARGPCPVPPAVRCFCSNPWRWSSGSRRGFGRPAPVPLAWQCEEGG